MLARTPAKLCAAFPNRWLLCCVDLNLPRRTKRGLSYRSTYWNDVSMHALAGENSARSLEADGVRLLCHQVMTLCCMYGGRNSQHDVNGHRLVQGSK